MTIGSDLLKQHFETLLTDNGQWQSLIDDDLLWELVYEPSSGHPAQSLRASRITPDGRCCMAPSSSASSS
jgi:hypothetical protein